MSKFIDLTDKQFGQLKVIKRGENTKAGQVRWWCQCDCENPELKLILGNSLKNGNTKSCGCYQKLAPSLKFKKYNTYDLSGEYGIGWTSNTNKEFYFDLEEYEAIKDYCWNENDAGYIITEIRESGNRVFIRLHRLVMGVNDENIEVDHIKHKTNDNRKSQLRIATSSQNKMNQGIKSHNTSGVTGVWYNSRNSNWCADIMVNRKKMHIGSFTNFNEAVKARKLAEERYFGKYSYVNSIERVV